MAFKVPGAFDMLIPDDEVKVDGDDAFNRCNLRPSAFSFPIFQEFDRGVVVVLRISVDHSIHVGCVFSVDGFRFIDRRNRTFLEIAA